METKKAFEAFENEMIDALRNGIISINAASIDNVGGTNLYLHINHECPKLISEIYQNMGILFKAYYTDHGAYVSHISR